MTGIPPTMLSRSKRLSTPKLKKSFLLFLGSSIFTQCAWAETPLETEGGKQKKPTVVELETVTVTGEKTGQDLQRTYSGISVVSDQEIEDLQIRDVRSTFQLLPNVNSSPSNRGNNGITIRGINSEGVGDPGQNSRPMSSLIIDGATQSFEGTRRGARGLWDVSQVEVYRGPQATLQGRNAIAGAVVIKTNDPSHHWEGAARTSFARLQQRSEAFMISGPILENELAFRLTHESIEDGHGIRFSDPALAGLGTGTYHNTRFKVLFTPSALRGLSIKYTYSDSFDSPASPIVQRPFFNRVSEDKLSHNPEKRRNNVRNQILEIGYEFESGLKINSISSGIDTSNLINAATQLQTYQRDETRIDNDFTQDIRISYATGRISVFGGLFYGRFRNAQDSISNEYDPIAGLYPLQDLYRTTATNTLAAYGEINWKTTDRLSLIFGVRQEIEKNWTDTNYRSIAAYHLSGQVSTKQESKPLLPKFTIAYDVAQDQTLAATISQGFRSGFTDIFNKKIDSENLMHYELAYRAKLNDGKLIANANIFRYDWTDQQISINRNSITSSFNAKKSELYGAELQIAYRPIPSTQIGASAGLLKTRFDDFVAVYPLETVDYSGKEFPEAPRRTIALWGSYRHTSGVFVSADASYKSSFFATSDLLNAKDLQIPGYTLVNLRVGYETDHWSAIVFCNNLFDRQYILGRDLLSNANSGSAYVGDPRLVGMTLSARF